MGLGGDREGDSGLQVGEVVKRRDVYILCYYGGGLGARAEKFPEGGFAASVLAGILEMLAGRPLGGCPSVCWGWGWMTQPMPFHLWCSDSVGIFILTWQWF